MSDAEQTPPGQPDPTRPPPDLTKPPAEQAQPEPGSYGQVPPPPQWGDAPQPPQYGQPQWQQPPWGQQAPPSYPPAPQGYHYASPEDSGAQASLITGILGLVLGFMCGLGFVASPFALVMGLRSKRRIDASGGQLGGRGNAQAGFILGLIGTVLLVLAVLAAIAVIALIVVGVVTSNDFDSSDYGTAT